MESENISFTLFKEKYYSDNWQKYENESDLLETTIERKIYWNNKLIEYQKDKINLDYTGAIIFSLDVNYKSPKNLLGIGFDAFCQKKIALLKIGSIKEPKDWTHEDYYKHYLQTKRFGFSIIKDFRENEYDEIKTRLLDLKELYFFIYTKLPKDEKERLYDKFNQQLKVLIKKQYFDSNKTLFKNLKKEINSKEPQQKESHKSDEVKKELIESKHPNHDPNLWNSQCYKLFMYLFDNYYDEGIKTNRKLTNIWHFFKESEKSTYNIKCTQKEYKNFLIKEYDIKVGNFTKADKYLSEYSTINEHRINFESY
jgi:hypothetical protein